MKSLSFTRATSTASIRLLLTKKTESQDALMETVKKSGLLAFVAYYHRQADIPLPSSLIHSISVKQSIRTHTLAIPAHTLLSRTFPATKVSLVCNRSAENASQFIMTKLVGALLVNVDAAFIADFVKASRSAGKLLDDQLEQPLELTISKQQEQRMSDAVACASSSLQEPRIIEKPAFEKAVTSHYTPSIPFHEQPPSSSPLPIHSQYATILQAIHTSQVTIISAETGKTTQIPQFILSSYMQNKNVLKPPRIVVTQPRKIAATSVAERVASERGEQLGVDSAIGYAVRFDEVKATNTENGSALFCTTGVLLRRLQTSPLLSDVTHILIDEVHERDLNTDLLLSIITGVLRKRKDLRVVLMSATANTSLFQSYFKEFGPMNSLPPVIKVLGKCFPVTENYLGQVQRSLTTHRLMPDSLLPFFKPSFQARTFDEKNMYLRVIQLTIDYISSHRPSGAILVFLSGWQEISFVKAELLKDTNKLGYGDASRFKIFALHSSVPMKDQKDAFTVYDKSIRKIILATNIAETSITIKDVVYVVDSGIMKVMRFDSSRQLSTIQDECVSQSNTRQRIGRAGRVQTGEYYSMLSAEVRKALPHSITTEIQRCDLQSTVLQLKSMHLDAKAIINATPEPPLQSKVVDSIERLENLGAIDSKGTLTTKGSIMAKLPMLPWISNLIIQGIIYKCLDPLLTIAAIISTDRSPFSYNPSLVTEARSFIRKNYVDNSNSDQITALNAINSVFQAFPDVDRKHPSDFEALYLKKSSVLNIKKAKAQYYAILEQSNIYGQASSYPFNLYSNDAEYVKSIFGKCLYPNAGLLCGKNLYKNKQRRPMRLTGGSVNSFSAQVECEEEESEVNQEDSNELTSPGTIQAPLPQAQSKPDKSVKKDTKAKKSEALRLQGLQNAAQFIAKSDQHIWNFESVSAQPVTAPSFPRLLMYQELQQIESSLFMRNTSELSPLAYTLLTSARIQASRSSNIYVDGWLDFKLVGTSATTIENFRSALVLYEGVVVDELLESGGRESVGGAELHAVLKDVINN